MKVAVIGASGRGGSRIVDELARRGHQVTAIARNPEKIKAQAGVTAVAGDLFDAGFAKLLAGHDAVVSAVHFSASDPRKLIEAVRASGAKRYLVMGGAGSLEVAPGVRLIDTPAFPAMYKDEAAKGGAFLDILRGENGAGLDVSVAAGTDRCGDPHRKIPPGQGPVARRWRGQELHLVRGLCGGPRRRDRAAAAFPPAVHCGLLKAAAVV